MAMVNFHAGSGEGRLPILAALLGVAPQIMAVEKDVEVWYGKFQEYQDCKPAAVCLDNLKLNWIELIKGTVMYGQIMYKTWFEAMPHLLDFKPLTVGVFRPLLGNRSP